MSATQLTGKVPRRRPDGPRGRGGGGLRLIIGCVGGLLTAFFVVGVGVSRSSRNVVPSLPALTEIRPAERAAAITTISPSLRQQLDEADDKCPTPLAEVAVAVPDGASPGMIQIRSGSYISPPFKVTTLPQRIAIPFPAEYSSGRGTISVLGTADMISVALEPIWNLSPLVGVEEHLVVWNPHKSC